MRLRSLALALAASLLASGCLTAPLPDAPGDEPADRQGTTIVVEPRPAVSLEPGDDAPDPGRGDDAYWMVWVRGNETLELAPGEPHVMCGMLWDHDVRAEDRALSYNSDQHDLDVDGLRTLVVFDVFHRPSDCGLAYTLNASRAPSQDIGEYGPFGLQVHDDGSLTLHDGTYVAPGERARIQYETRITDWEGTERRVTGEFTVELTGAWPRSGLQPRPLG